MRGRWDVWWFCLAGQSQDAPWPAQTSNYWDVCVMSCPLYTTRISPRWMSNTAQVVQLCILLVRYDNSWRGNTHSVMPYWVVPGVSCSGCRRRGYQTLSLHGRSGALRSEVRYRQVTRYITELVISPYVAGVCQCGMGGLPKSTPSDTLPLAIANSTAPRPLSHA